MGHCPVKTHMPRHPATADVRATDVPPSSVVPRPSSLTDVLIAVGLALAVIATRYPVRSRRAFNWDAVNFVLALAHYDVRLHHPHPPGYPAFVAMGKLLSFVIPDANGALVAAAMLLSAGAVAALYWLGRALFDRATGVIAALYLLFSVTFWTNGAVALAYPSLAFFGTLVALFAWRLHREDQVATLGGSDATAPMNASRVARYSLLLSAAYALGGGFRPDLLLFLAPLWLWGHRRAGWRQTVIGALVVATIIACWAVPMVALSGGIGEYLKVFRAYAATDVLQRYSVAANGPRALLVNVRDTATYTGYALYALALPVLGATVWLLTRAWQWQQPIVALFALWVAPMLLFYTWVHIGDPGYVFTFVPALLLVAGRFTATVARREYRDTSGARADSTTSTHRSHSQWSRYTLLVFAALVALPLAANTGIFLKRPLTLTASGIRQEDRTVDGKIAYVRAHGDPATTLLVSYESYRHWLLYLPEYRTQFVDVTYGTEADRTTHHAARYHAGDPDGRHAAPRSGKRDRNEYRSDRTRPRGHPARANAGPTRRCISRPSPPHSAHRTPSPCLPCARAVRCRNATGERKGEQTNAGNHGAHFQRDSRPRDGQQRYRRGRNPRPRRRGNGGRDAARWYAAERDAR